MQKKYQMPFNPRALWHWAFFNNKNSVMCSALESMQAATKSNRPAYWYETTGKTDRAGMIDTSTVIWFEQQRQQVRAIVAQLPKHQKNLGNVLYMPAGEISNKDFTGVLSHLNIVCRQELERKFPTMRDNKKEYLEPFVYCALCHYWDAISPALDGAATKTMDANYKFVHEIMEKYNKPIITRRWQGEWKGMWDMIISEIRKIDNAALKPLDAHIEKKIEDWSGYKKTEQLLKTGSK